MNSRKVILGLTIATLLLVGGVILLSTGPENMAQEVAATGPVEANSSLPQQPASEQPVVITAPESVVPEIRYVPDELQIPEQETDNPALNISGFKEGNRSLTGIREVVSRDELGGFINPRLSPDGLQVMLTRPGFDGIYVVSTNGNGEQPDLVADVNAWTAKWTADSRILVEVNNEEVRLYNLDGTLEYSEQKTSDDELAYSRNDMIYVAGADGEAAVPLTDNSDRFIAPVVSPNGDKISYIGLQTGLYISPADGSSEPSYLGEGYNVSWSPDGDSIVFDRPIDDGHYVVESDIYHYDLESGTLTNLTADTDLVGQYPDVGPDGSSVTFESEGSIYFGVIE